VARAEAERRATSGQPGAVLVRDVQGIEELRACQALQRRAWGITEDGYVVPVATMAGAQKAGGLVLGAFEDGRLVGFSFAFLGRLHGRLVLYSQLTAIEPAAQGRGLGRQLKAEQRRWAGRQGLEAVAWAFDPLQASNAFFNFVVLGAASRTYEVDLYGSRSDRLNAGLQTDRLVVEWPTAGPLAGRSEAWPDLVDLLSGEPGTNEEAVRRPAALAAWLPDARHLAIEVPADIAVLKATDPALARAWQLAVRAAFQQAFAAGFSAVGFSRRPRPRHLLEQPE
jgi:predicted GNAT superfamily acetyltransferase